MRLQWPFFGRQFAGLTQAQYAVEFKAQLSLSQYMDLLRLVENKLAPELVQQFDMKKVAGNGAVSSRVTALQR